MRERAKRFATAMGVGFLVGIAVWGAGMNAGFERDLIRLTSFGSSIAAAVPMIVNSHVRDL